MVVCVPLAGLEIGLLAGAGFWVVVVPLVGLETAVDGVVTLLALLLGGGLLLDPKDAPTGLVA